MKKYFLIGLLAVSFVLTSCGSTREADNEIAVNTESEEVLASADLDVDTVIKETEEVETSEVEASEILETPEVEVTTESVEMETTAAPTPISEVEVIEETPTPTADEPTTTVPKNADAYIPFDAGKTYTVMSGGSEEVVTVPGSYTLPYIVNGRDIRSGDLDGDGISDNHQNTWYEGHTYTASNGVTIRIADGFELIPGHGNVYSVFTDGTENIEPNSSFMVAFHEYCGQTKLKEISAADLPAVQTVSTKQTSINRNYPSFITYSAAFNPLWSYQTSGTYNDSTSFLQPINLNPDGQTTSGIGLVTTSAGAGYIWTMKYDAANGYWKLQIKSNMTELEWNSILNSLRMVTPDADAVYTTIYHSFYYSDGALVVNYNNWVNVGSTQVKATDNGYILIN